MLAAHSSSVAKALAGIDGSAKAAAAIGATVRSVVQLDVFFSVLKAGDWGEMALRIGGRLLLGGESNESLSYSGRANRIRVPFLYGYFNLPPLAPRQSVNNMAVSILIFSLRAILIDA